MPVRTANDVTMRRGNAEQARTVDQAWRAVLSRAVRAYLAVTVPDAFDAVVVGSGDGLLLLPSKDFARRQQEVADVLHR
jgi:hypothetical protein